MLTKPIVVIISQYIRTSNHYIVHHKHTMLYIYYISVKLGKKDLKSMEK